MTPNLFAAKNIIVQGITGSHGSFHTTAMLAAGTNIVAGTSPNKAGTLVEGVPVFKSVQDIQRNHTIHVSVIFVPAPFAKAAILEAIDARIPLVICITEGIPVHDMLYIKQRLKVSQTVLVGPNCPGVLMPGINKLGIIPAALGLPGTVGVVSRSGTLTYEAVAGLTHRKIGQKYIIGIGGDPIHGMSFIDCLKLFQGDPEVTSIVIIGEIGGTDEQRAAGYIRQYITKPVYGYVAGQEAPIGVQLGHAGAILGSKNESALAKSQAFTDAGVHMSTSILQLIQSVK